MLRLQPNEETEFKLDCTHNLKVECLFYFFFNMDNSGFSTHSSVKNYRIKLIPKIINSKKAF